MKFSIGYNHDIKLLDLLGIYKDHIEAFYFPIPIRYIGTGRDIVQPQGYIKEIPKIIRRCNSLNITSQLLLNVACEGRSGLGRIFFGRLVDYIKKLKDMGLGSMVITNPIYVERIKKEISGIRIESSVNCYVKTVEHALYLKDLGVDVLTIDRDINRNIPLIKEIKDRTGLKIKLMLNEGCLRNCPFRVMHYNYLSHHYSISRRALAGTFPDHLCFEIYSKTPSKVFSIPFIPPDALRYFEPLVDYYKLSTRVMSTNRIELCLKAYIDQQFNGNLLEILDSPGLSYFEYVDYNVLSKSNFFEKMLSCSNDCASCGYCNLLFKEAALVNRDLSIKSNKKEEIRALGIYKKALKNSFNKDNSFIYERLSKSYFNLREYKKAIKELCKLTGLNYTRSGLHFLLGLCYEKNGEYDKAIEEFKKEEKIKPEDARIPFSLARCYIKTGRTGLFNKEVDRCARKIIIRKKFP